MKKILRKCLPGLFPRKSTAVAEALYATHAEALAACGRGGYEEEELVRVVVEKNRLFREKLATERRLDLSAVRTLFCLGLLGLPEGAPLRVLDFGGGGGYHWAVARTALGSERQLRWNVVETKAMTEAARPLAGEGLGFFSDLDAARLDLGGVDLVFTSGALQYCPKPLETLRRLIEIGASYLFLTRSPFHDGKGEHVTIQRSRLADNGPGPLPVSFADRNLAYPLVVAGKDEVERLLLERYDIAFSITEEKGSFRLGERGVDCHGYFCVLRR